MCDSDSDYIVEEYLSTNKIVAPVLNDEDGDILGNFDDEKLKYRDRGSDEENSDSDTDNIVYDRIRIIENEQKPKYAVDDIIDDTNELKDQVPTTDPKVISEDQLKKLLHGSSKVNRFVLYVTNLTRETTKNHLEEFFSTAGTIKSVRIPKTRASNFAFVEMKDQQSFQNAFQLHNKMLQGRQIKVQISEAGKKKSANKKNIMKQKNRVLAEMRNESKSFLKSGKSFCQTKTGKKRAWARSNSKGNSK